MNHKIHITCFAAFVASASLLQARIGETEADIEARYGRPISKNAFLQFDSAFDRRPDERSASEREMDLQDQKKMFPDKFRADGSQVDLAGDNWLIYADDRLVFFDSATAKWEDLRSSILGKTITAMRAHEGLKAISREVLQAILENAQKHLRQRFYIRDNIRISVMYMDGLSVSESYSQKGGEMLDESKNKLIQNSFPGCIVDGTSANGLMRLLASSGKDLAGCATLIDSSVTVSATPYYAFLKGIETELRDAAKKAQESKLDGF